MRVLHGRAIKMQRANGFLLKSRGALTGTSLTGRMGRLL
jgi:hypothetical protein